MAAKKTKNAAKTPREVSAVRLSELALGKLTTASSGKLAQFLDTRHPDCRDACQLYASLFYNSGGDRYTFKMNLEARELLIQLAPGELAAREALAAAASALWRCVAYPEARSCIDALVPFEADAPWAPRQFRLPWADQRPDSLTGPRQLALLHLYRAECLLAEGLADQGEQAFEGALARAALAAVPSPIRLSASSQYWGTHADFRVFALVRAARAVRLQALGEDVCAYRKPTQREAGAAPDPAKLVIATRYAKDALRVVAARAPSQYASLDPHTKQAHDFTPEQRAGEWQFQAYLEAALLDELNGHLGRARHRAGQAMFLTAPYGPSLDLVRDHMRTLDACVVRLGAVNTPLDTEYDGPA